MSNVSDSGGGGLSGHNQEEDDGTSKWFTVKRKDRKTASSQQQQQGSRGQGVRQRQRTSQAGPPSPLRGAGSRTLRPMTDGGKLISRRRAGAWRAARSIRSVSAATRTQDPSANAFTIKSDLKMSSSRPRIAG